MNHKNGLAVALFEQAAQSIPSFLQTTNFEDEDLKDSTALTVLRSS